MNDFITRMADSFYRHMVDVETVVDDEQAIAAEITNDCAGFLDDIEPLEISLTDPEAAGAAFYYARNQILPAREMGDILRDVPYEKLVLFCERAKSYGTLAVEPDSGDILR